MSSDDLCPEYNTTATDFADRSHLSYSYSPLIDFHVHVSLMMTKGGSKFAQAESLLAAASEFGVEQVVTMSPIEDIDPLRERFGTRLVFNGFIDKKPDEPDDVAYDLVDRFAEKGAGIVKLWAALRASNRGLFLDAPWRVNVVKRARSAGIRIVMVHVADPDIWFRQGYANTDHYGRKMDHYAALERMLEAFPDIIWIAAHMGGAPEHPDLLESLLERHQHLYLDTSATKWQVREVSRSPSRFAELMSRFSDRFLVGSDLVTRDGLAKEHYVSRYWCQRTLWESQWCGRSPIEDEDWKSENASKSPTLSGLGLDHDVLAKIYYHNAVRLFAKMRGVENVNSPSG